MKNISDLVMGKARQKSREDERLRQILCQNLDEELIKHIQFFQISDKTLKLTVGSSTWASRLRFFASEILNTVQKANIPVMKVKIGIAAFSTSDTHLSRKIKKVRTIPTDSLGIIDDVASSMEDTPLQASLKNLIRNARNKSKLRQT